MIDGGEMVVMACLTARMGIGLRQENRHGG
jgi:hypothetical protein